MGKKPIIFFILLVTLLFASACAYSAFDKVREADFLSHQKYEDRDIGDLCAEKASSSDSMLISAALFLPFWGTVFELLPGSLSSNTSLLGTTFSVLRC